LSKAPIIPTVIVDADGTVHLGPRTIPPPTLESAEARKTYSDMATKAWASTHSAKAAAAPTSGADVAQAMAQAMTQARTTAIAKYPVDAEDTVIGGVKVSAYTPKNMPGKNRDKILMEFEIEQEAIAIANLAQMKVLAVHYRGAPFPVGQQDIVAVYRELLKTY